MCSDLLGFPLWLLTIPHVSLVSFSVFHVCVFSFTAPVFLVCLSYSLTTSLLSSLFSLNEFLQLLLYNFLKKFCFPFVYFSSFWSLYCNLRLFFFFFFFRVSLFVHWFSPFVAVFYIIYMSHSFRFYLLLRLSLSFHLSIFFIWAFIFSSSSESLISSCSLLHTRFFFSLLSFCVCINLSFCLSLLFLFSPSLILLLSLLSASLPMFLFLSFRLWVFPFISLSRSLLSLHFFCRFAPLLSLFTLFTKCQTISRYILHYLSFSTCFHLISLCNIEKFAEFIHTPFIILKQIF